MIQALYSKRAVTRSQSNAGGRVGAGAGAGTGDGLGVEPRGPRTEFQTLSVIDDVNSVRVGGGPHGRSTRGSGREI